MHPHPEEEESVVVREQAVRVACGLHQERGDRPYQEDRLCVDECVRTPESEGDESACFAGCFDGHGGSHCSLFLQQHLLRMLTAGDGPWAHNVKRSLISAFGRADEHFLSSGDSSGSTALVCLVLNQNVWLANAGDCRAVLFSNNRSHQLTRDHCPSDARERARVERSGGTILHINERHLLFCGLVHHKRQIMSRILPSGLSVARALGDSRVKEAIPGAVVPAPDVFCWSLTSLDEFLILASDGVFGAGGGGMSNAEACSVVRDACRSGDSNEEAHETAKRAARYLVRSAVESARSLGREADNCSAIVLIMVHPQSSHDRTSHASHGSKSSRF